MDDIDAMVWMGASEVHLYVELHGGMALVH